MMNLRIEPTKKARDLLYKLERKKAFREQFESANAFIEFSLEQALKFYDRKPFGEIRKYAQF